MKQDVLQVKLGGYVYFHMIRKKHFVIVQVERYEDVCKYIIVIHEIICFLKCNIKNEKSTSNESDDDGDEGSKDTEIFSDRAGVRKEKITAKLSSYF